MRSRTCRAADRARSTHDVIDRGFVRSNDDVAYPNLMFHFLPIAIRYDGSSPAGGHGYQVHIGPMYSDARGHVRINSTDPKVKPSILFNYLSTDQDRREWVEAIRIARNILGQPGLAPFDGGEISPGPAVDTDERQRLIADLGKNDVMILRNHGLLACGRTIAETFNILYWLEMACKAQVDAMSSGAALAMPNQGVPEKTAHLYAPGVRRVYGEMEWEAMLRQLDREDPSYRN